MLSFFFKDTATTEIYTLSLHDALPISIPLRAIRAGSLPARRGRPYTVVQPGVGVSPNEPRAWVVGAERSAEVDLRTDRKSTRLNSSHANISYAVFCLKKKNQHHAQAYS